jgi:thiamine-monophosphate kinase
MASEFDFIRRIRQRADEKNQRAAGLARGIGDDCAILKQRTGCDTVITTDLLVEEIDFRREWTTPRLLGHKALAVSLSDIAAMGASPRFALLSIGVPQNIWRSKFLDHFYEGFYALADAHKVALVGGDVSRTPERIVIDSIVIGETKRGQAVTREGAVAGDIIFVTGTLGGAGCALRLLEAGTRLIAKTQQARASALNDLLLRQLRPQPRVAWGLRLGAKKLATAMIDVSDGLSSDLFHLCEESGVGADIEAARLPVDPLIMEAGKVKTAPDALALALDGGEDYELLFTVRPTDAARVPKKIDGVNLSQIGVVTNQRGRVRLIENKRARKLLARGFTHF